jgi:exonuclease III
MKLHLISQNVQGLNGPEASQRLRNFYSSYFRHIDVLCLQEHKLRGSKMTDLGPKVWKHAHFFGCEASAGYRHIGEEAGAGRGGVCLLVNPNIKHLVHSQGSVGRNQAQWIRFSGHQDRDIGVLNVYAPHTAQERIRLWQELRRELPGDYKWVACGDWNFVEERADKSTRCGRILTGMELLDFNAFKAQFLLQDFFSRQNAIIYSWDNLRRDGERVLARLDRVYSFACEQGQPSQHIKEYIILGNCCHSDHKPVLFKLDYKDSRVKGAKYKMNGAYLKDPAVVERLKRTWVGLPNRLKFFAKLKRTVRWYKEFCLEKARQRRERELVLRQQLEEAQLALQQDPLCPYRQEELVVVRDSLQQLEAWKMEGQNIRARV